VRRWTLLVAGAALWLFLAAVPALADGGPHVAATNSGVTGGLTADTCAGCHRAHTAQGNYLLKEEEGPALCLACHGAAGVGATTDVETGQQYKPDGTTFLASIIPPWFNMRQLYATIEKLRKVDFTRVCVGHFGMWDGSEAEGLLDEAGRMFDAYWKFFEDNIDRLDDADYLRKAITEKFLSRSGVVKRVGEAFPAMLASHMRDGYRYAAKSG